MSDINNFARKCIQNKKEYIPGKPVEEVQRELGLTDIVKLASNENPLGASPLALAAMHTELDSGMNFYPQSVHHNLLLKLSAVHDLSPQHICTDNGADGILSVLGLTFIDPGDEIVMTRASFPDYEDFTTKMDGKKVLVPYTPDYRTDVDGLIAAITPKTKLLFICNPDNPAGSIITNAEFKRLLANVPESVLVVSDEAYYDYVTDPNYPQTLSYLPGYSNLVIIRTFSKIMGLAGVRFGYAMAHPGIIRLMMKTREPFPVNRIAQAGALAALDDQDFKQKSLQVILEGRRQIYDALAALGVDAYPSHTNFVLVDLGQPAQPVFDAMLREGVIVRPLVHHGLPDCLRITIGTREQNERMIRALPKALESSSG